MHRNNMATAYLWAKERMRLTSHDVLLNNFPLYSNVRVRIISLPEISEGAVIAYKIKITKNKLIITNNPL